MSASVGLVAIALVSLSSSSEARCSSNPASADFRHGPINITVVSDGPFFSRDNFFNVPDQAVQEAQFANFLPRRILTFEQNIFVVDLPHARVMIDTGSISAMSIPLFRTAGKLQENLIAAGISPASIDAILLTHGHPDHAGGLISSSGDKLFPRATVYIGRVEHEFWTADPIPNRSILDNETIDGWARIYKSNIAPYNSNFRLVEYGDSPIPGFTFIRAQGHSAGHAAISIRQGRYQAIAVGDAWVSKANQVQHPEWAFFTENDSQQAFSSRFRLLEKLSRDRTLVLSYHEQFPGIGHILKRPPAFDWVPSVIPTGTAVSRVC